MSAVESTRVALIASSSVEVHLKKNIEITQSIASQVSQLPTGDPWVVLLFNTNASNWNNAQTFSNFEDADQRFVTLTRNRGVTSVDRLKAGKSGRVITE